jgi:ATP-dependent RNA helicase RhlE
MYHQIEGLRHGVDIVIATPGRLLDHMQRRTISLSQVEVLVLDEGDRMLDMGFIDDVRRIISAVPRERQTMLFSATMPPEVRSLAIRYLKDPVTVESGEERNPIETINQKVYRVARDRKTDLLIELLKNPEMKSVLVFSRTRHGADRITRRLERAGMRALAIHSDLNQSQRLRALEGFKRGHCQALVATEIAARGIDVEGIDCVINYDVPEQPGNYIHRIGRTGRAEHEGDAITFVAFEEEPLIKQIERFIGKKFERLEHPDFPPEFQIQKPQQQFEQRAGASMRQGSSGRRFSKRGHPRRVA